MYKKYFDKKIFIRKAVVIVIICLFALICVGLLSPVIYSIYMLTARDTDERGVLIPLICLGIILTVIAFCLMIRILI